MSAYSRQHNRTVPRTTASAANLLVNLSNEHDSLAILLADVHQASCGTEKRAARHLPERSTLNPRDSEPTEGSSSRRAFPGEESQVSVMRGWLTTLIPECPARYDVACVATELASNAVRHTATGSGGWFVVDIVRINQFVRVKVTDPGVPTASDEHDDLAGEHGWGLIVVRGLSVRMGSHADHTGRVVWADVLWDEA